VIRRVLAWMACAGLAPGVAQACAVCGLANTQNQSAFLGTTILLSLLPLAMIGGGVWWARRTLRSLAEEDFKVRDAYEAPVASPVRASRGTAPRRGWLRLDLTVRAVADRFRRSLRGGAAW
jgi:hypothetical protein